MAASEENMFEDEESGGRFNLNRRFLLIGVVALALICLVAILIYRILNPGDDVAVGTPTPTPEPTEGPTVIATIEEEGPTVTPTRVISEQPGEPTAEPTTEPTTEATATTAAGTPGPPTPFASPTGEKDEGVAFTTPATPVNVLENGDFEKGVDEQGVGLNWQSFTNGGAVVSYSAETSEPHVRNGTTAQRISIAQASRQSRYAGIYQSAEVRAGQPYTLTLHGQIRTGLGDIEASGYGYRMQYAIDDTGGTNWQAIPDEDWVELPWDEQRLDAADVEFLSYETTITPSSDELTLFIRGWNKWADPGLAEYTLDDLSLVGRPAGPVMVQENGEALIPETGAGDRLSLLADGRFWGAVLILMLLAGGAIYRGRWGY